MPPPHFSIDLKETATFISNSPYEWSKNAFCYAVKSKVVLSTLKFQEEFDDLESEVELNVLSEFHHRPRVQHIAWSPNSSLHKLPNVLQLCVAGSDFSFRIFTANLSNKKNERREVQGHDDHINACCYDSEGELLASVSDDLTCKLWAANDDFGPVTTFHLTSPGMMACWHPEQPNKLLVAEKCGVLRIYSTLSLTPISSVVCSPAPLVTSQWPTPNHVIFLAAGILHKADISIPGHMVEQRAVHTEGGYSIAACPANINYIATVGRPNSTLKITNIKTKMTVFNTELKIFGGFTWHSRLPILCVANNSTLEFYRITPK